MPDAIPSSVLSLIKGCLRSIAQLELLLKLHDRPDRAWSVADAAKELYTAVSMSEPLLEALCASGLAARSDGAEPRYQYAPKSDDLAKAVDELAQLYPQRRVTIVNLLYPAPEKQLQDFADAFRIRKKEEQDE